MGIPKAIAEAAQAADLELKRQGAVAVAEPPVDPAIVPPVDPVTPPIETPPAAAATPPAAPAVPPQESAEYWKARFDTIQGKYNTEVAELRSSNQQMSAAVAGLTSELNTLKAAPPVPQAPAQAPEEDKKLLEDAYSEFGEDVINPIIEAAKRAVMREIAPLQAKVASVESAAQTEAILKFEARLDTLCKGWDSFSSSPEFIHWLNNTIVPGTGNVRYAASFGQAKNTMDADSMAIVMNAYLTAKNLNTPPATPPPEPAPAATPASVLTPLQAMVQPDSQSAGSLSSPAKPIYTELQATGVYNEIREAKSKGIYYARKAELDSKLADVEAARMEGRIRG